MKNKVNKKILIIVAVAAVLLVGVMLLLIFLPNGGSGTATFDEGVDMTTSVDENGVHQAQIITNSEGEIDNNSYGTLTDYVPATISSIHVENQYGSFDVESYTPVNEDGTTEATQYTLVGYEDFELQTGIPDAVANDAAALDFTRVISLDGSNSSEYGFDNPVATVTVYYTDNTSAVYVVGNNALQDAGTYVKFGDSDTIYLVETDAVDAFSYGITDMISLTINDSASDSDNSKASSITIGGTHLESPLTIVPNTNENISASYMITEPIEAFAGEVASSNVDGDIRGLYATGVKMVNPSDSQLEKLGLAKPYATLKAVYPDATVELIASEPDSDGNVYLMEKGEKVVYTIAADSVVWVTTTFEDMLNEYVLMPKMPSVSEVTVNDGSKDYKYTLSSKTTTTTDDDGNETTSTATTVNYGDKEIETSYFSTYFRNITLITLADTKTESFGGSPAFSVTYSYSSGGSDNVSFYDTGSNRYLAVVNGTAVGHVYNASITKLVAQSSKIAANELIETL